MLFASPTFAQIEGYESSDWPTDCEVYPYLQVCINAADTPTNGQICLGNYYSDYESAKLRAESATQDSIYWWNVQLMNLYQGLIDTFTDHIAAGGKVGDAVECDLEPLEIAEPEEVEELEPAEGGRINNICRFRLANYTRRALK